MASTSEGGGNSLISTLEEWGSPPKMGTKGERGVPAVFPGKKKGPISFSGGRLEEDREGIRAGVRGGGLSLTASREETPGASKSEESYYQR